MARPTVAFKWIAVLFAFTRMSEPEARGPEEHNT
jgi:hypothetical protein